MLVIEGEASKIEYSIDNGKTWYTKEDNPVSIEYTFENQEVGSYFVRVRVTDKEGKSIEAISDIVRVGIITTAEVGDVIEGKTYITGEGKLKTGEMTNNAAVNDLIKPGDTYHIAQGYHNGEGTVTADGTFSTQTEMVEPQAYIYVNGVPGSGSGGAEYTITLTNTYKAEDRAFLVIVGCSPQDGMKGGLASCIDGVFIVGNQKRIYVCAVSLSQTFTGYIYYQVHKII